MFTLDDDDKVIVDAAREFSDKRIAPHAIEWDEGHHFPKDVLREAAEMGMGAIYVSEDVGGSGMRRLDGVRIFEQLARGCPSVAGTPRRRCACASTRAPRPRPMRRPRGWTTS